MSTNDKNEPVLSRWSSRKRAAAHEKLPKTAAVAKEMPETENAELEAELDANRVAAEAIDLDSISEDSDLSVFLKDGVPAALKRQAFAALWRSSPVFANVDGLVDYDDDFGSSDLIMKAFKSAYQVGQGYKQQFEEIVPPIDEEPTPPEPAAESASAETQVDGLEAKEETEAKPETESQPESEVEEPLPDESTANEETAKETAPRISLRKRLQLDTEV